MSAIAVSARTMDDPARISSGPDAGRTRLWIEVAVVLLVAVVPDLFSAVASIVDPQPRSQAFWHDAVNLIQRSATVSAVILLLMWLSGDGWARFGLRRWRWRVDPVVGAALLIVGWLASGYTYAAALQLFPPDGAPDSLFDRPSNYGENILLLVMSIANGFAEELAIWGFLFTRFLPLLRSAPAAICLCAALFASYHLYQGTAALISVFVAGLLHGVVFWRLRRLWPLVVSHAIWDVLAISLMD